MRRVSAHQQPTASLFDHFAVRDRGRYYDAGRPAGVTTFRPGNKYQHFGLAA
jgi:hypothetical protein